MARVVQGNKAVVGATVTAFVNRLTFINKLSVNPSSGMMEVCLCKWSSKTMGKGPTTWLGTVSMQSTSWTFCQIRYKFGAKNSKYTIFSSAFQEV